MALHLPQALRRDLEAWARAGYPHEACGLLLGRSNGEDVYAKVVTQARNLNVERARDRYELDPEDFLRADARARREGIEIVGVWHTHPDHPARPSETDLVQAWERWSYLILSVNGSGVGEARAWRLNGGSFVEDGILT
jgi:proteasome lid subunit RPN8/RPN11